MASSTANSAVRQPEPRGERSLARAALFVLLMAVAVPAGAAQRFPRPQLPSWYQRPHQYEPPATLSLFEYIDVAVLVAVMGLATWLVLKTRSRRTIFLLMVFSLLYFGSYRKGCLCPIGATQHVAQALLLAKHHISIIAVLLFMVPLVFAVFFGRVFCAAVCPLGAMQDVVLVKSLKVPRWLESGLGLLAPVHLGLAVLFAVTGAGYIICRYDPFVSFFRLSGSGRMFALGGCVLVISMFVGRAYCRFLCPYGFLLRLLSKVSYRHATITPDECVHCRLCEDACPFGAIRPPTRTDERAERAAGKIRLALLILAFPAIIALGALIGHLSSSVLALAHPTVKMARAVRRDEGRPGQLRDTRSQAFDRASKATGRTLQQLRDEEAAVLAGFASGSTYFGAWVGLLVACRLITLAVRRTRPDYEAERGPCLSCGRCFSHCPREHRRLKIARGQATDNSQDREETP